MGTHTNRDLELFYRDIEIYPYIHTRLGDKLAAISILYLAKSLNDEMTIGFIPVKDGVTNPYFELYPINGISSENRLINRNSELISLIDRLLSLIEHSLEELGEPKSRLHIYVCLIALIHMVTKSIEGNIVELLETKNWLTNEGLAKIKNAIKIYKRILITIGRK